MSIISKLTVRHLKENRKRTIVTILGIAMSTALITAMMVGVFSIFKFLGYVAVITEGDYHAGFSEVTAEQLEKLQSDDRIESIGITESDNERSGIKLNYGKEDRFSVGNIMHLNRAAFDQMITGDYEGTFPQNAGEIAVEQEFLDDNDLNLAIGDELEFTEGHRYTLDEDGDKIYWAGGYRSEEKFQEISKERCVITAILHGNRPSEGWDILRGLDGIPNEMGATIKLKKCDHTAIMQIKDIAKSIGATKYSMNTEYLLSVFAIEGSGAGITNLFTVFGIGLIIVVFTSVVLIYNAFGMSLAERVRYLGMLASVGATGRQKRGSVFFEGFILGIIGIPAGIILGIIGTTVTLNILGAQILESDMIAGAEGLRGSVPTVISPYVIAAIVLLAAVTIFISSFVPAFKASGIMPIDALRQSNIVRVRGRKLRVNPLIRRLFGYEGELAYKNIKRNGIKGTVIKLSIAISIIMFLAVNYICDSMTTFGNAYDLVLPYQVSASCSYDEIERLRNEVKGLNGVSDIYLTDFITYGFEKPGYEEKFTPANTDILNTDYLTKDYSDIYDKSKLFYVVIVDDEKFKGILNKNGISADKYFGSELKGVLLNNFFHDEKKGKIYNEGILGQILHYDDPEGNPPAITVEDFVSYDKNEKMYRLIPTATIAIYVPQSMYYKMASEHIDEDALVATLGIECANPAEICEKISDILEYGEYHNYTYFNASNVLKATNTVMLLFKTSMYGFVALLTLIAMANIVNTISTSVILRRKEFAMYRSVGLTDQGFKKMIHLETFLYGIHALIIGIPIAILLSYAMYSFISDKMYSFDINWGLYLLVIIVVFALVGLSMLLSVNKIKDDTIIDVLKEDIS